MEQERQEAPGSQPEGRRSNALPRDKVDKSASALSLGSDGGVGRILNFFRSLVLASEQDICPTEGRDVRQEVGRVVAAFAAAFDDGLPEMLGIPIDDDL